MRFAVAILLLLSAWVVAPGAAHAHAAHAPAAALVTPEADADLPEGPAAGTPCHCPGDCAAQGEAAGMGACCHLAIVAGLQDVLRALPRPDRPQPAARPADSADPGGLERPPRG